MKTSNKPIALWVIFMTITMTALLYTQTGIWLSAEFAIISIPAIFCWFRYSKQTYHNRTAAVPLYILAVTVFLVLSTIRYSSGYAGFLYANYSGLFNQHFVLNDTSWFIMMICVPVSAMLAGGYYCIKGSLAGSYFAWWTFFFSLMESIIQFGTELLHAEQYVHQYYTGVLAGIGLFLLGAYGLITMLRNSAHHHAIALYPPAEWRRINLWSALFVTLVILYGISLYGQAGLLPVGVIAGSMMGGMIGWRKTTARQPADPYKLVPLYLLLQALFYIHVGEETLTHFNRGIAAISGHAWKDTGFNYLIALIGPAIWVFAAWSLWKGQAFGNFILWFMIVGMILGEPTHVLIFPIIRIFQQGVGYEYFSGMYTSLFPMIPAIIALTILIKDYKERKAAHA